MQERKIIWLLLFVGSIIGSWVASMMGFGLFSIWSIVISTIGGALGILIGYKINTY